MNVNTYKTEGKVKCIVLLKCSCKFAVLPAKFDARRQLKYNVQPDWSNQIITAYLIGQFKP